MQYNSQEKRLETTIVLSAHDFEQVLFDEEKITTELSFLQRDSLTLKHVESKILADFIVLNGNQNVNFNCIGFELLENGLMNCYFTSETIELKNELSITFACLMKEFPEQQNKLTFIYKHKKETLVFLQNNRTSLLTLKHE